MSSFDQGAIHYGSLFHETSEILAPARDGLTLDEARNRIGCTGEEFRHLLMVAEHNGWVRVSDGRLELTGTGLAHL